jgi:DNA-binding XRE family transcriptional regulator
MKLSEAIRTARFHKGQMTQEKLAKLSGYSRVTIIAIENDRTVPRWDTVRKLAEALDLDLSKVEL